MLSPLLLQIDLPLGLNGVSILLCGLGLGVVLLSGLFFLRRSAAPATPANVLTTKDAISPLSTTVRRSAVAVLVTDAEAKVEPLAGSVVDRSTEGITLELEDEGELEKGTQVKVRPAQADVTVPWVLVEVVRCRKVRSVWRLKCRYVRVPPYSIRMLFG